MALENTLANSFQELGQQDVIENEQVSSDQLDYSTANDPLGDFNGFNMDMFEEEVPQTGDPIKPAPADKPITKADLKNDYTRMVQSIKDKNKNRAADIAKKAYNPYQQFNNYEFDQYATNVDRYRGYGKETFNKLGFNPLENNEDYYNKNTSSWQDFKRMSGEFPALFGSAFTGNYKSIGRLFSGSDILTPDYEGAEDSEKAMRIGMSSKKGAAAFFTNFALQSAYSVGIMTNILAEEAAIWGVTALTGGAAAPASAAAQAAETGRIAVQLGRLAKSLNRAFGGQQVAGMFKGGVQMIKSFKDINRSREFFTGIKTGANTFGRGAAEFINPFRQTTEAIQGIRAGEAGYRNLSNYAKLSKSFGGFYRDMRENWFSISESQLEGGGVYRETREELITKYMEAHNGQLPRGKDLEEIEFQAQAAGRMDTLVNIPMIFLSNRFVFDGLFNFKGVKHIINAADDVATKGVGKGFKWNLAERSFGENAKGFLASSVSGLKNPKRYVGSFLNYTKANISEALQELGQETAGGAIKNYYINTYQDPSLGGSDYAKSMVYKSLGENVFSSRGIETALSGFLMGGFTSTGAKLLTKTLRGAGELYMAKVTPEKYTQYIQNKAAAKAMALDALNTVISNPEKFFSRKKESIVNQRRADAAMSAALDNNDDKTYYDAKDDKTFDVVFTALDNNTFGMLESALKDMKQLSDKELAEAFNLDEGVNAKAKLDEYISRAKEIKQTYDFFQKKFPNPFNPSKFRTREASQSEEEFGQLKINEFIAYKAWEDAKKTVILSQASFERATSRMVGLFENLTADPVVKNSSALDYTVLQSEKSLRDELRLLKEEVKGLEASTDASSKSLGKKKARKMEALQEYYDAYKEYSKNKVQPTFDSKNGIVDVPADDQTMKPLEKAFKKYIKAVADINDDSYVFQDKVNTAFLKIMDYYSLSDDAQFYADVVNKLNNPDALLRHAEQINANLNDLWESRLSIVGGSIDNYFGVMEMNQLMLEIGKLGAVINPADIEELALKGKMPSSFFDLRKNTVIDRNDPRYEALISIVETFANIKKEQFAEAKEAPVETKAEKTPVQETKEQAPVVEEAPAAKTEEVPKEVSENDELIKRLRASYDTYVTNNPDSDITFEYYSKNSTAAKNIRDAFVEEQKQKEAAKPFTKPAETKPVVTDVKVAVEVISEKYTPELLRANPNKLFLFGDNNARIGKGGQAVIRDEPNAAGISTKLKPANTDDAFMSDKELAENKAVIDSDIKKAKERATKEGKTIVLPKGGFGTGLAALAKKAPQTFAYLNQRLQEEFGFNNTTEKESISQKPETSTDTKSGIKGVEISSNAKGIAAALTNPTELAKSKGNITESYPVEFRGKKYKDAEAAYQALKNTATKDEGPNSTYNLMVDIIKAKLKQHPRLVTEITKQGRSEWILASTHQPTKQNSVWETGGKNWFIKALNEAYLNVSAATPVSTDAKQEAEKPIEATPKTYKEVIQDLEKEKLEKVAAAEEKDKSKIQQEYRKKIYNYFVDNAPIEDLIPVTGVLKYYLSAESNKEFVQKINKEKYGHQEELERWLLKRIKQESFFAYLLQNYTQEFAKEVGTSGGLTLYEPKSTSYEKTNHEQIAKLVLEKMVLPLQITKGLDNDSSYFVEEYLQHVAYVWAKMKSEGKTTQDLVEFYKNPIISKPTEKIEQIAEEPLTAEEEARLKTQQEQIKTNTKLFSIALSQPTVFEALNNMLSDAAKQYASSRTEKATLLEKISLITAEVSAARSQDSEAPITNLEKEIYDKVIGVTTKPQQFIPGYKPGADQKTPLQVAAQKIQEVLIPEMTKEMSGLEKAQTIVNSIESLRDIPDVKLNSKSKVTTELLDLIAKSEVTSEEVLALLEEHRKKLSENITKDTFKKGDYIIFTDGKRGWVQSVLKNGLKMKIVGSEKDVFETIPYSEVIKTFSMIEKDKKVSLKPKKTEQISPEAKEKITESKAVSDESVMTNVSKIKKLTEEVKSSVDKDNSANENDLLNTLGC